ncbi:PilZ domain-containing protein [Myxococcota bacterium]|nr:PilZ domain-containing protein [Myxococcota bacterium]MBU1432340.1 PilZ domain-containing protein [Myxococcota bacterium]MBU1898114.1 PilZ domain-containing protein [Myxococcota bacterium]
MTHFRRSQRYRFQLEVSFELPDRSIQHAVTQDVSLHGVFLRTDVTLAPNQFLPMTFTLPQGEGSLSLLGVIARAIKPTEATEAQPSGMGVSFFGNPKETSARWATLIEQIRAWVETRKATASAEVIEGAASTLSPGQAAPPARRASTRFAAAHFNLTVRPSDLETLRRFSLRDVSAGGTFINTAQLLPVGASVELKLVHPLSGARFTLPGLVVRAVDALEPREKGLGIRFRAGSIDMQSWGAFLEKHAPQRTGAPSGDARPDNHDTLLNVPSPLRAGAAEGQEP